MLKLWGETDCIFRDQCCEIWRATVKAGGYSSLHRHLRKSNAFHILSGTLKLEWLGTESWLRDGQAAQILAGVWHRFHAYTDVEMIEVYVGDTSSEDIERKDTGGIRPCAFSASSHAA